MQSKLYSTLAASGPQLARDTLAKFSGLAREPELREPAGPADANAIALGRRRQ